MQLSKASLLLGPGFISWLADQHSEQCLASSCAREAGLGAWIGAATTQLHQWQRCGPAACNAAYAGSFPWTNGLSSLALRRALASRTLGRTDAEELYESRLGSAVSMRESDL